MPRFFRAIVLDEDPIASMATATASSPSTAIASASAHRPPSVAPTEEIEEIEHVTGDEDHSASDAAASASDTVDSDADQVANQSADESAPGKRKKATGHKQKAKKKKGGFTNKSRCAFKADGNALATGSMRTCIPDALYALLHGPDVATVRSAIMGDDLYADALFTSAQSYVATLGMSLRCVTSEFNLKGGLAFNLLNARGRRFLVQLLISYGPRDDDPDDHCIAYDGLTLRDNNQYRKVKVLDDGDRATKEAARAVFDSLSPNMMIRIKNVFELTA